MKAPVQLVLPLLGEAAGADDEAALEVATGNQLFDQQAGHNRLARARVIGQQEAQRLTRQHRLVDGSDLVGQRLNQRGMDGKHRVKEVSQPDTVGLRDEAEEAAITVEAPRAAHADQFQRRLALAVEQHHTGASARILVGQLNRLAAIPRNVDHGDQAIRQDTSEQRARGKLFQTRHCHLSATPLRRTPSPRGAPQSEAGTPPRAQCPP